MTTECRCRDDNGAWCYAAALANATTPEQVDELERLNISRLASGVPFHVIDQGVLAQIAAILRGHV